MQSMKVKAGPPEQDWADHRALISRLYETNPLHEVMRVLEADFGFKASEKMYKSRISKWRIDKRCKRREMLFLRAKIHERRRQGKPTRIMIRNREVSEADIERYLKRQKTTREADELACKNPRTPNGVVYETPVLKHKLPQIPPSTMEHPQVKVIEDFVNLQYVFAETPPKQFPVCWIEDAATYQYIPDGAMWWPVRTASPQARVVRQKVFQNDTPFKKGVNINPWQSEGDSLSCCGSSRDSKTVGMMLGSCPGLAKAHGFASLSVCEALMHQVRDYFASYYFYSNRWGQFAHDTLAESDDVNPHTKLAEAPYDQMSDPGHLASAVEVAIQLFSKGQTTNAGMLINSVCKSVGVLVKEQHPQLLSSLLVSLSLLRTTRFNELSQIILEPFHDFSELLLGPEHPLTLVSSLLARASRAEDSVADLAMDVLLDTFTAHTGAFHPARLHTMYIYGWATLRRRELAKARSIFENLQGIYETHTHPDGIESRKVLYSLAQVHIALGKTGRAKKILEEHQRRTERRFGPDTPVESKIECLRVRALLCKKRLEFDEMDVLVQQAWDTGVQLLAREHPTMLLLEQEMAQRRIPQYCAP